MTTVKLSKCDISYTRPGPGNMNREEYFAAVLLVVGPPRVGRGSYGGKPSYYSRVIEAMCQLAPLGPTESLGYSDYFNWYWAQVKEKEDESR